MYNTLFEVFIVPMNDDGCSCVPEEDFSENAKVKPSDSKESEPCAEGTCDCMGKEENYFKPRNKKTDPETLIEFDVLFAKYNEANKLVINLNKQNELLAARNEQLTKTNDYLIEQNKNIKKKYMEVFEALKAFEKRVSSLPF